MFFAICLAHNRTEIIRGGLENFEATTTPEEKAMCVKQLYFCSYPLPSIEQNREDCKKLCEEFGWRFMEIPNVGILANHNLVLHELSGIKNGDYYITFDPDVRWGSIGWVSATKDIFDFDPDIMFISSGLDFHHHEQFKNPPYSRRVRSTPSGTNFGEWGCVVSWASGTWRADFLLTRPRHFGEDVMYGNSESTDYARLMAYKKKWVSLVDFIDKHFGAPDQIYLDWKLAWAHGKTNKSFIDFIKEKNGS